MHTFQFPEPVNVQDVRGLVAFLYILLRDYLPAGSVEKIMVEHVEPYLDQELILSNEHLEAYARELAARLVREWKAPLSVTVESMPPGADPQEVEERLEDSLITAGLLKQRRAPITDLSPYRDRQPIEVQGEPVSETIIKDRR
jgi:hypothetical protein